MGYTKKEQEEINTWLVHVGALSDVDEPFEEFKKGQLLEIARAEKDSIMMGRVAAFAEHAWHGGAA